MHRGNSASYTHFIRISVISAAVVLPNLFLNAYEQHYPLTAVLRTSPLLIRGKPVPEKQFVAGLVIASGSSSKLRTKASAGAFGHLGLISDLLSTGFVWTNEAASGQLTVHPLRRPRLLVAASAGGQYSGYDVHPFCTACAAMTGSTVTPYAGLKYATCDTELLLSEYG